MKHVLSLALAAALVVPAVIQAQAKPNFAGTWTLDALKSDPPAARGGGAPGGGAPGGGAPGGGAPGGGGGFPGGGGGGRGGGGPLTIAQTAADVTIGNNTYKLDGSEVEIQGRGGVSKAKATWDGAKLVITTTSDMQGMAMTTKAVYSLSADGKELTRETTNPGMQGGAPTTRKQVYTKG